MSIWALRSVGNELNELNPYVEVIIYILLPHVSSKIEINIGLSVLLNGLCERCQIPHPITHC